MTEGTLLFVEDDPGLGRQLRWAFSDFSAKVATDRKSAIDAAHKWQPKVIVLDLGLPPDTQGVMEGLKALEMLRQELPCAKIIIMSGNEDRASAIQAISLGAYDFCQKPMDLDILKLIIDRALNLYTLEEEHRLISCVKTDSSLRGLISCAPNMLEVCSIIERVAPTDVTIMLLGESGTGKEVLARALHDLGPRAKKPFVAINCGAIPEALLESELFGHEKGSFTGAQRQIIGKVELANGGTLFLDEIGDIPAPLQVKLLRFLQERVIERIGGRQLIPVDVRIVCATNKNLEEEIKTGQFREDLFYRLNEFSVKIPALRDREGDVEILAHYFLNIFNNQFQRKLKGFQSEALNLLQQYLWPGNVRELQSKIKRAVLMATSDFITIADLSLSELPITVSTDLNSTLKSDTLDLRTVRAEAERIAIERALQQVAGNISKAAKTLGVSRPTMYSLLQTHNIKT